MQESQEIDALVVGAGVIGLAVAARLAAAGREVLVAEAEDGVGRHASSRNSEVLHAGFYYEPGSAKARHCRVGKALLVERARRLGIPHSLCGKLVVAVSDEEVPRLEALLGRGRENGVPGLELIDAAAVRALEPEIRAVAAMHSHGTGIIDSHAVMTSFVAEIERSGGVLVFRSPIDAVDVVGGRIEVRVGGHEPALLRPRILVNAAGFGAPALWPLCDSDARPEIRLVRGHYLEYGAPSPIRRLVYPLPEKDGLGIHATLDLAGRLRFGPDTLEVDRIEYGLPEGLVPRFAASIRRYWPGLDEAKLVAGYAGIRTKAVMPDGGPPDFRILGPEAHGWDGLIHLIGIESPGLSASLSIAEEVAARLAV